MANILDSLDDLFSAIGEKTSGSIEATKLTFYVNAQEKKLTDAQKKIGAYYFTRLLMEGEPDEDIADAFEEAKDAQERIAAAKMRIRELEEIVSAPITPGRKTCPVCGELVENNANYCPACGAAFAEDVEPEEGPEAEKAAEEAEECVQDDAAEENAAEESVQGGPAEESTETEADKSC